MIVPQPITAPDFPTLTSRAKGAGLEITLAIWCRFTAIWTAHTRPMHPMPSRTYLLDGVQRVALWKEGGVYVGSVDGVQVPYGEACRVLATAQRIRLIDEAPLAQTGSAA